MVKYCHLFVEQIYISNHKKLSSLLKAYPDQSKLTENRFSFVCQEESQEKASEVISKNLGCDSSRVNINNIIQHD